MPKLIDYPRTSYTGAWELSEVVDDTGGKCAIETAARKLDRKVSGSFKAIIGSAVKFGLLTSKRELLNTTTLFKRIKHAYDKQEELVFHREAFLTPPLFVQICRKFRTKELPIQMLDVMLIREFGVEEINAQGVAKAFVEGCRMVGILNEHNVIADIDSLANQRPPRREIANPSPASNSFRGDLQAPVAEHRPTPELSKPSLGQGDDNQASNFRKRIVNQATNSHDAIASLFGLVPTSRQSDTEGSGTQEELNDNSFQPEIAVESPVNSESPRYTTSGESEVNTTQPLTQNIAPVSDTPFYQIQISGPGMNTSLSITEEEDIILAIAFLEKIRRQLAAKK